MTLPIYLAAHLIYGVLMGGILLRRMRAEGEVVGGWFLHGLMLGDSSIPYERFHLGLMVAVGLAAGISTLGGLFFAIAVLSRDKPALTLVPLAVALIIAAVPIVLDGKNVLRVPGTNDTWLFLHPAGLVSLAVLCVLAAAHLYAKRKVANVLPRPTGPGSIIAPPMPPIAMR
jgi:hypothetical protein